MFKTYWTAAPDDPSSKLRDNLKKILKLSKYETQTLIEILGSAEIIKPLKYNRKEPGKRDWTFITFWRGEDGYDRKHMGSSKG